MYIDIYMLMSLSVYVIHVCDLQIKQGNNAHVSTLTRTIQPTKSDTFYGFKLLCHVYT